jgi:RNA polymerase sigma-70 factor (ECF subfamily)
MPGRDPFADPQPLIRRVYAYVAYRIGDGADAEDVTSATFERALRYRDRFDSRKGDAAAWMIGIARRQISDHYGVQPLAAREPAEELATGELETDAATRIDLRHAVVQLTERERELIGLRYGADLTARQIGEVLGLQTNAVEVALHRALQELRRLLEQPGPGVRRETSAHGLKAAE